MKPSCLALGLLAASSPPASADPLVAGGSPLAKKDLLRAIKLLPAPRAHATRPPAMAPVTLFNVKTHEALPVVDGTLPNYAEWSLLLRCHFTGTVAWVDARLEAEVVAVARALGANRVEIVSGYRDPKYNRLLRKKGHEVAGQSLHTRGQAVDFRLPGVSTRRVRDWLLRRRAFGVGYYPDSGFVHLDVGPARRWSGQ